jgi:hypothetical protein
MWDIDNYFAGAIANETEEDKEVDLVDFKKYGSPHIYTIPNEDDLSISRFDGIIIEWMTEPMIEAFFSDPTNDTVGAVFVVSCHGTKLASTVGTEVTVPLEITKLASDFTTVRTYNLDVKVTKS